MVATKVISVNVPEWMIDLIKGLVEAGFSTSRSEYFRHAVTDRIERDIETLEACGEIIGMHKHKRAALALKRMRERALAPPKKITDNLPDDTPASVVKHLSEER